MIRMPLLREEQLVNPEVLHSMPVNFEKNERKVYDYGHDVGADVDLEVEGFCPMAHFYSPGIISFSTSHECFIGNSMNTIL